MGERFKIVVFDLDGTLVKGSTFNSFILFLFNKLIKRGEWSKSFMLCYNIISQLLNLNKRAKVKYNIMKIARESLTSNDFHLFANKTVKDISSDMIDNISHFQSNGYQTILLSASPSMYVNQIGSILKFDNTVGTPWANSPDNFNEIRGEYKALIIKDLLPPNGRVDFIFTDHHDDFQLISQCQGANVVLVNPSKKLINLCQTYNIPVEFYSNKPLV